ncbi:swim zinc finger domain protein [Apiospora sp. TS-2023a]
MEFDFGVEIEAIVEPHKIQRPFNRYFYLERLAAGIKQRGGNAVADTGREEHRKHPEHYHTSWWITNDDSLGDVDYPGVTLEGVSPKLRTDRDWESEVDRFWDSMKAVFHMPVRSPKCGSHVHISPASREFTLSEVKRLAFGVLFYETATIPILPRERRDHEYCVRNSERSPDLKRLLLETNGLNENGLNAVASRINKAKSNQDIIDLMQGDEKDNRRVLWNFANLREGGSGSVEFRGGRGLRGPVRTKRWIAFAVAFVHMVLDKVRKTHTIFQTQTHLRNCR